MATAKAQEWAVRSKATAAHPGTTVVAGRAQPASRRADGVNMSSRTILVTGGAGYIGSHMSVALLERGHDVVIVLLNSWGTLTRIADAKRIRTWMESQNRASAG